jgi:lactoylglutathione lyase
MLHSIRHVGIVVQILEQSIQFYNQVLGLSIDRVLKNTDLGASFAFLSLGSQTIELIEYVDHRAGQKRQWGQIDHICFNVQDIEPAVDRLKKLGVKFHSPQTRNGPDGKFIFLEGPDGERIELQEINQ